LHLKIRKIGNTWYSAEIVSQQSFGYGDFSFDVASNVEQYDQNVVAGLFTYLNDYHEIDTEFSRWGDPSAVAAQYVVQKSSDSQPSSFHRFAPNLNGDYSTHRFTWRPGTVDFESYYGIYSILPDPGNLMQRWSYSGANVPTADAGLEKIDLNFWLMSGLAPTNGQEAELVIKAVHFDAPPVIASFTAIPAPVTQGLTLTASNVSDADGTLNSVEFYRDANSNGMLDLGVDQLVGSGSSASGVWTWVGSSAGFPLGSNRFIARAQDNDGAWSSAVFAMADNVSPGTVTFSGGDNTVSIKKDVDNTDADVSPNGGPIQQVPLSTTLMVSGGDGNDIVTIDFSNGNPLSGGGISFNGSGGANTISIIGTSDNDSVNVSSSSLTVTGGTFSDANISLVSVQSIQFLGGSGGSDALNIMGGNYNVDADNLSGAPNISVTVGSGAVAQFTDNQHLAALILNAGTALFDNNVTNVLSLSDIQAASTAPGTGILEISALSITAGGMLDIGGNELVVHNADFAAINGWIRSGFNFGQGGYSNGTGIKSSTAAANTTFLTTLGVLQSGTDVSVKYTYYGDADLSGTLNGADYQQIDHGFGQHLTGWFNGDFNNDGVVNGTDYSLIDNTLNQIAATSASPLATPAVLASAALSKKPMAAMTGTAVSPPIFSDSNTNAWKLYIESESADSTK
jgi:hypothetical protein